MEKQYVLMVCVVSLHLPPMAFRIMCKCASERVCVRICVSSVGVSVHLHIDSATTASHYTSWRPFHADVAGAEVLVQYILMVLYL